MTTNVHVGLRKNTTVPLWCSPTVFEFCSKVQVGNVKATREMHSFTNYLVKLVFKMLSKIRKFYFLGLILLYNPTLRYSLLELSIQLFPLNGYGIIQN